MKLAVGKFYHRKLADSHPVRIVHEIARDTIEYRLGCRFIDEAGHAYQEDGGAIIKMDCEGETAVLKISRYESLVREADADDLAHGYLTRFYVSPEEAAQSEHYIHRDHPDFYVGLGNVYLLRTGIPVHIDAMLVRKDETRIFKIGNNELDSQGMTYDSRTPSIYDLVYMRRNYEAPRSDFMKKLLTPTESPNL